MPRSNGRRTQYSFVSWRGEGADFDHQREAQIVFEQAKGRVTVRVGVRATIRVRLNLGLQLGLQVERLDLTKFG